MTETLKDYVQHKLGCKRGRVIEPVACPSCGERMSPVRNTSGYLNSDQFDAVKAGDWFCKRHDEAVVYAWESSLPKHGCTCGLDNALSALAGIARPPLDAASAPPLETDLLTRYVECEDPIERDRLFLLLFADKIETKTGVIMTWEIPYQVAMTLRGIANRRCVAASAPPLSPDVMPPPPTPEQVARIQQRTTMLEMRVVAERVESVRNQLDMAINLASGPDQRGILLSCDTALRKLKKDIGQLTAGLASPASPPRAWQPTGGAHDWRWDDVFKVYRCNACLVAGNAVHEPVCPKAVEPLPTPPAQEEEW